jgi:hypothetical protein
MELIVLEPVADKDNVLNDVLNGIGIFIYIL